MNETKTNMQRQTTDGWLREGTRRGREKWVKGLNREATDRNQTFGGEHDVSTTDANWECCTPGTYAMLQTNVTLTINILKRYTHVCMQEISSSFRIYLNQQLIHWWSLSWHIYLIFFQECFEFVTSLVIKYAISWMGVEWHSREESLISLAWHSKPSLMQLSMHASDPAPPPSLFPPQDLETQVLLGSGR